MEDSTKEKVEIFAHTMADIRFTQSRKAKSLLKYLDREMNEIEKNRLQSDYQQTISDLLNELVSCEQRLKNTKIHLQLTDQDISRYSINEPTQRTSSSTRLFSSGATIQGPGYTFSYSRGNSGPPSFMNLIERMINQIPEQNFEDVPTPLNIEILNKIPIQQFTDDSDETCLICTQEFRVGDSCRLLPCDHLFHVTCIDRWFSSHNKCPTCRYDLSEGDHAMEE